MPFRCTLYVYIYTCTIFISPSHDLVVDVYVTRVPNTTQNAISRVRHDVNLDVSFGDGHIDDKFQMKSRQQDSYSEKLEAEGSDASVFWANVQGWGLRNLKEEEKGRERKRQRSQEMDVRTKCQDLNQLQERKVSF